jgi:hypothetical protein
LKLDEGSRQGVGTRENGNEDVDDREVPRDGEGEASGIDVCVAFAGGEGFGRMRLGTRSLLRGEEAHMATPRMRRVACWIVRFDRNPE